MGGATFKYDDDDDHGIPILQIPSRSRSQRMRLTYSRYRNILLVVGAVVLVLYWFRGTSSEPTDWSRLAYAQYATDTHTLCNALMIFEALKRLGSKADRVLIYPEEWENTHARLDDRIKELLQNAKKSYSVNMKPAQLLSLDGPAEPGSFKTPSGYGTSITKFRLFELEEYDRVLYFDGDSILRQHMDELFQLPPTAMAMPRAYWSDRPRDSWPLSSTLMLISPNVAETKHLYETLSWWRLQPDRDDSKHYDNDVLNDRFGSSALVLPHRPYLMQSSEFRSEDHTRWLGSYGAPGSAVKWDPHIALAEAKLIHFSDWPLPKPWVMWPMDGLKEIQPGCGGSRLASCDEREIWKSLYDDFRRRRRDICKILSVPAPQNWEQYKNETGAT